MFFLEYYSCVFQIYIILEVPSNTIIAEEDNRANEVNQTAGPPPLQTFSQLTDIIGARGLTVGEIFYYFDFNYEQAYDIEVPEDNDIPKTDRTSLQTTRRSQMYRVSIYAIIFCIDKVIGWYVCVLSF